MKDPSIGNYFTRPVIDVKKGVYPVVQMRNGQYCIINRGLNGYGRENPPTTGDLITFVPLADNRVDAVVSTTLFGRMIRLERKQLPTST